MNTEIQEIQLNTYPAYKDSGVEWLGEIPEYWEVKKMKSFLTVHGRIGFRGYTVNDLVEKGEGAITISPSNMGETEMVWDKVSYLSWEKYYESPEIMVEEGDLLVVKTASIGKIAYIRNLSEKATINPQILVLKNIKIHRRYFYYQLLSEVIQRQLEAEKIGSTIYTISENKILNFITLVPPITEQTTIANFLDDKCAKIDAAVEIKQQQIELLKERRQIAIHQAVTQGLDKNVPMKDSGVKWIGEIPEHWVVKKLKQICKAYGRIGFRGYTISDLVDKGEGAITISPSNIKEQDMTFEKSSYLTWEKYYESPEIQVFENDILIVKTGSTFGKVGIVKKLAERATINPQLLVLKNVRLNADYLYELLVNQIVQCQIKSEVIGSTIPTISETKILNIEIALPSSADEILKINDFIKSFRAKINSAISLYEQEIEKLKEYKTTLINSAVTGKIKVPGVN